MNEFAMLLYIIQYPSKAVLGPEYSENTAKTMKTQLLNLEIGRGGGNKLW
jgi:hypothetical protein